MSTNLCDNDPTRFDALAFAILSARYRSSSHYIRKSAIILSNRWASQTYRCVETGRHVRSERGTVATGCAVLGSLLSIIVVGVFLALAVIGKAHAAQPRTEYLPCGQEPMPRNCVYEPHATGADGIVFIGESGRIWRLPHHIAHSMLYLTSPHGAYEKCANEDSKDCVWDARHRGNGMGQSFYTGTGRSPNLWYLPHHVAHFLLAR
jgi:hypothetical protein